MPLPSILPLVRWIGYSVLGLLGLTVVTCALILISVILAVPDLPSLDALTDYRPKIPLQIYTADGHLIGEFGEERRSVVQIEEVPAILKHAILAAEDERFYQHNGVDSKGVLRAIVANLTSGGKKQGASTITMQVARNFYLSSEKTLTRKLYEALLSFKIESSLSKDNILQLYVNQIYLGQRAYGFSTAAQVYFGKPLKEISLAEAAMLAGLPKAPSAYNPVANFKRSKLRQQYVLRRMLELNYISTADHDNALSEELHVRHSNEDPLIGNEVYAKAGFVAEMARQIAYEQFQDDIYSRGYKIITTILKSDQDAAYLSLRKGVMEYDRRHGYRGPEAFVELKNLKDKEDEMLDELISDYPDSEDLLAAIVLEADRKSVKAYRRGGEIVTIKGSGLKFASEMLGKRTPANKKIRRGAVIRISITPEQDWEITQLPDVEAALVSANPHNGEVRALVGGFDFDRNMFNHVTQAWRQPGSSFKPFIYSAALEKGFTPASIVDDEPVVVSAEETGNKDWEPKNYDGKYDGPMTLRKALIKSKNMVSIRVLQTITPQYAQDYARRFGFDAEKNQPYLTLALGSGAVTPWQELAAYSVFANGGYAISPYVVKEIRDNENNLIASFVPTPAGDENRRVIDARNAYLMNSMLQDVTIRGTAARVASSMKRYDLAGKTGTTNDYVDAWFAGYHETLVSIAWVGFDQPKRLGRGETGSAAALPIWIDYMTKALDGVPEFERTQPEGLVAVDIIDPEGNSTTELMYVENLPVEDAIPASPTSAQPETESEAWPWPWQLNPE